MGKRKDDDIAGKVGDSARKTEAAEKSGNKADKKAAEASYDDMKAAAKAAGLLDEDD